MFDGLAAAADAAKCFCWGSPDLALLLRCVMCTMCCCCSWRCASSTWLCQRASALGFWVPTELENQRASPCLWAFRSLLPAQPSSVRTAPFLGGRGCLELQGTGTLLCSIVAPNPCPYSCCSCCCCCLPGGHDITKGMRSIYSIMGLCPQHDLLWNTLSGHEHLLFYGTLKGMSGGGGSLCSVNSSSRWWWTCLMVSRPLATSNKMHFVRCIIQRLRGQPVSPEWHSGDNRAFFGKVPKMSEHSLPSII